MNRQDKDPRPRASGQALPEAIAETAFRRGDLATARGALRVLSARDGLSARGLHMMALIEKQSGNTASARSCFERAVAEADDDPDLHNNFANFLDDAGEANAAIVHYRKALSLRPAFADAAINLGLVCNRTGRIAEAREAFESAGRTSPENPRVWYALGSVLFDRGDMQGAEKALDKALALHPGNGAALLLRARVEAARGGASLPFYARARASVPDSRALQLEYAVARFEAGEGLDDLRKLTDAHPGWAEAHKALSRLCWEAGRQKDFAASYERALDASPKDTSLWTSYLATLMQAGFYEEALNKLQTAQARAGQTPWFALAEAICASECGDSERADRNFARLSQSDERGIAVAHLRHLLRNRRPEQAIARGQAVNDETERRDVWPYLAAAWRLAGDRRWEWFACDPRFIGVFDLGDSVGDLDELALCLRALHTRNVHPFDQSLRGGTQTVGSLFARREPAIADLRKALHRAIRSYIDGLPPSDGRHPLLAGQRGGFAFWKSWSSCLAGGGLHLNHVHPAGWISSAFYVSVPETLGRDERDPQGWLGFGAPPATLGLGLDPFRLIEPKPGRVVLFPSLLWHGTQPFTGGERLSVAFDVVPAG
jgi:tetratricopeptide (TPR) repeat protein